MKTILLDTAAWDFVVDLAGNIAVADDPYAMAQDAASAIKLFAGELYYDTTKGVPYWTSILGKSPPTSLMKEKFVEAALTVPGVVSAKCFISALTDRGASGQIQVIGSTGATAAAGF